MYFFLMIADLINEYKKHREEINHCCMAAERKETPRCPSCKAFVSQRLYDLSREDLKTLGLSCLRCAKKRQAALQQKQEIAAVQHLLSVLKQAPDIYADWLDVVGSLKYIAKGGKLPVYDTNQAQILPCKLCYWKTLVGALLNQAELRPAKSEARQTYMKAADTVLQILRTYSAIQKADACELCEVIGKNHHADLEETAHLGASVSDIEQRYRELDQFWDFALGDLDCLWCLLAVRYTEAEKTHNEVLSTVYRAMMGHLLDQKQKHLPQTLTPTMLKYLRGETGWKIPSVVMNRKTADDLVRRVGQTHCRACQQRCGEACDALTRVGQS